MAESVQGMDNNNDRLIMWTTLSVLLVLTLVQHVDAAPVENRPFEKYMLDLYNAFVDKDGLPKKGIATMDDNVRCFLPGNPGASSSKSRISLNFDIREVPKDEQVIKAALIDPNAQQASARTPTRFSPVNGADSKDSTPNLLNLSGSGWKSTDVTSKAKTWHKQRHKKNTIHLDRIGNEDDIFSRNLHKILQAPFLVVHSRSNIEHAKRNEDEDETASLSKPSHRSHYMRSSDSRSCRIEKLEIEMSKIGWERSILAPSKINVNRCEGDCGSPVGGGGNRTWNAILRGVMAGTRTKQDGKLINPPCCAPVDFTHETMLKIRPSESSALIELKTFRNVVAKSCGCV